MKKKLIIQDYHSLIYQFIICTVLSTSSGSFILVSGHAAIIQSINNTCKQAQITCLYSKMLVVSDVEI